MPPKEYAWVLGFMVAASVAGIFLQAYGVDGIAKLLIAAVVGIGGGWGLSHLANRDAKKDPRDQ